MFPDFSSFAIIHQYIDTWFFKLFLKMKTKMNDIRGVWVGKFHHSMLGMTPYHDSYNGTSYVF